MNVQLPLTTRILLATLAFLKNYGLYLLGAAIVAFAAIKYLLAKIAPVRYLWHKCLLFTPALSDVMVDVNMVNFTRVLRAPAQERREDRGSARYHGPHFQQPRLPEADHRLGRKKSGKAASSARIWPTTSIISRRSSPA